MPRVSCLPHSGAIARPGTNATSSANLHEARALTILRLEFLPVRDLRDTQRVDREQLFPTVDRLVRLLLCEEVREALRGVDESGVRISQGFKAMGGWARWWSSAMSVGFNGTQV